ncbi:MAG: hypothetical protein GXO22_03205 [Aquificae bacterium]|nr:hypothetical protein [Aquificota bacterium]
MVKIISILISASIFISCGHMKAKKHRHKELERKREQEKSTIRHKRPINNNIDIEDIIGR